MLTLISKIYFLGCWSNIYNKNKNGAPVYHIVFNDIKEKITQNDVLIIAGDNYYGPKDPNTKKIKLILEDLEDAFSKIPKRPKVFILLGNHDIDDFPNDYSDENGKQEAPLYNYIKKYADDPKNNAKLITFYDELIINNQFAFFFMDLKLYDHFNYDEKSYPNMYYNLLNNNVKDVVQKMESKLESFLVEHKDKTIFTVSHYPLVTVINEMPIDLIVKITPLGKIYKLLKNHNIPNINHLCADTHYFENGNIVFPYDKSVWVNQYIFGTGGAVLDTPMKEPYAIKHRDGDNVAFTYKVVKNNKSYGYGLIDTIDRTINFIPVEIDH